MQTLLRYLANLAILCGALLIAVQWQCRFAVEKPGLPDSCLLDLVLASAVSLAAVHVLGRMAHILRDQFWQVVVSTSLSWLAIETDAVNGAYCHAGVFLIVSVGLSLSLVIWPRHLPGGRVPLSIHMNRLWTQRFLMGLWLKYNIQSRYSQMLLGIAWIVLLPILTSTVIAIAFTQFIHPKLDVPAVSFFLSALVPFGVFQQGVQNSMNAVVGSMNLINRVYFPREILILLPLAETLVDFVFTFGTMLIVNALFGIWPGAWLVVVPVLMAILMMLTLGIMFFVSSLSVFIRDIPQLVSVTLQLVFFMTPIIYPIDNYSARYRILTLINPLAPIIQFLRDVIIYNHAPDVVMLFYPAVMALSVCYLGYQFFKSHEAQFVDVL